MPAVAGSYWIIDVGELTSGATQYPWAIVSVPFQAMVWVLARDIDDFKEKFDEPVVQELEQLGFTYFFNKPIKTYQSSTHCKYVDPPST